MLRHVKSAEIVDLRPLGDGLAHARTAALVKTKSKDEWVFFDGGVKHWVKGMQDSSVLLTILFEK